MMTGDAGAVAARWKAHVLDLDAADPRPFDLVVDALFGAGLSRALEGSARGVVERVAASGKPVLAVDLPSGLSGDTGQVLGPSLRATATVTFFRLKPAHLLMPGRDRCGDVILADIGIDRQAARRRSASRWPATARTCGGRLTRSRRRGA